MNLREWLFKQRLSITFFAALLKVDRSYVHRWMKGTFIPSKEIMERIRELTLDNVFFTEDLKDVEVRRIARDEQKSRKKKQLQS